jgi:hypothetical protein
VLLDDLAERGIRPGAKLNSKQGAVVAKLWLQEAGWRRDRWDNWKHPEKPERRIQVTSRSFKIQFKHGRGWGSLHTYSLIDWATGRLRTLAEKVGTPQQRAQAQRAGEQRKAAKRGAAERKKRREAFDQAGRRLDKVAMAQLRDEGVLGRWIRGLASRQQIQPVINKYEAKRDALADELAVYRAQHRDWPTHDDGELWSLEHPPYVFLPGTPPHYRWTEDGYTVTFDRRLDSPNLTAEWMIGATGGVLGFDPSSFRVRMYDPSAVDRQGDGYVAGLVVLDQDGSRFSAYDYPVGAPHVVLTMIGSQTKRAGTGRKLMEFVRRMVTGYGRDDFFIEAITPEGREFFDHLTATGTLDLLGRYKSGAHYRFAGQEPPGQAEGIDLDSIIAQVLRQG